MPGAARVVRAKVSVDEGYAEVVVQPCVFIDTLDGVTERARSDVAPDVADNRARGIVRYSEPLGEVANLPAGQVKDSEGRATVCRAELGLLDQALLDPVVEPPHVVDGAFDRLIAIPLQVRVVILRRLLHTAVL